MPDGVPFIPSAHLLMGHGKKSGKAKRKRRHRSKAKTPRLSPTTALLVVNSTKIRKKALSDCRRARVTFEKAEKELEFFEKEDKPAFVRWYRSEFGPLLEEMKEFSERTELIRQKMLRIRRFAELKRCHLREAGRLYEESFDEFERLEERLLDRLRLEEEARQKQEEAQQRRAAEALMREISAYFRSNRKKIQNLLRRGEDKALIAIETMLDFAFHTSRHPSLCEEVLMTPEGLELLKELGLEGALVLSSDEVIDEEAGADFDSFFSETFGDSWGEAGPQMGAPSSPREKDEDGRRLSALYREMAFALHPDQSDSGSDPAKLELWYQVQEAMQARDLDRMEVLHAHMQVLAGDLSPLTPVSYVMELTQMYRSSRDALRRRIRSLRKQVEWDFCASTPEDRQILRSELGADLQFDRNHSEETLRAFEQAYAFEFAPRQSARKKEPPAEAAPPDNAQTYFSWFS